MFGIEREFLSMKVEFTLKKNCEVSLQVCRNIFLQYLYCNVENCVADWLVHSDQYYLLIDTPPPLELQSFSPPSAQTRIFDIDNVRQTLLV